MLQDAKGNFVRRWIQRQLNFGRIYFILFYEIILLTVFLVVCRSSLSI